MRKTERQKKFDKLILKMYDILFVLSIQQSII